MKHLRIIALLVCLFPVLAGAQASRYDGTVYTVNQSAPLPGAMLPVLALSGATVQICSAWNSTACTGLLQTYQSATVSGPNQCPTSAQLYNALASACSSTADVSGGFGIWTLPGSYAYFVTTSYGTFGPYPFGVDAGGAYCLPNGCPQINQTYYANAYGSLALAIAAVPSGGTLVVPAGTFNLPATTFSSPITIVGSGVLGSEIVITGSPNVGLTIASPGVHFDNLDISGVTGQLFNVVGQTDFRLTHSRIHGTATQAYGGFCSAVVYFQGGSDHWVTDNEFTGNGISPASGASYGICGNYDISSSNFYTARVHFNDNWVHAENVSFNSTIFNCDSCESQRNTIDSGDVWDGTTQAYALEYYDNDEGICQTASRTSGTVTCSFSGSSKIPVLQMAAGSLIYVSGVNGTGGTSFSGVFTIATSSGTTLTWPQAGNNDTAVTASLATEFGYGHNIASGNHLFNIAGNGIYLQGSPYSVANGNDIHNPALRMPDTSLCQGGISLAGWEQVASANMIYGSGKAGICTDGYHQTITGNVIDGATHFGVYLRGVQNAAVTGNEIINAYPSAIGGDVSATPNATLVNIVANRITAYPGNSGISFTGPELGVKIASNQIKAPISGSASGYGVYFGNAAASDIDIQNQTIECNAESTTTATFLDGIYFAGINSTINNNTANACNNGSGFGIFEPATGSDNWYTNNTIAGGAGATGFESIGTNVHVYLNNFWNNTTPIACAGTAPDCTTNLLSRTGTIPVALGQLPSVIPSSQLPPAAFTYQPGTLTALPSGPQGPILYSGNSGLTFKQISTTGNVYTCSGTPTIELWDNTAASVLTSLAVTSGSINGNSAITVVVPPNHKIAWEWAAGVTCTAIVATASVNP